MQIRILLAIAALLTIGLSATAKAAIPNNQTGVFTAAICRTRATSCG